MLEILLDSAVGVEVPERTTAQFLLTLILVALFAIALAVLYRRNRWAYLPEEHREHKMELLGQLRHVRPATVRIPATEAVEEYETEVRDSIDRARARAAGRDVSAGRVSLREAVGAVHSSLRSDLDGREVHRLIPDRLTAALAALAVSIVVLGGTSRSGEALVSALESTSDWGSLLESVSAVTSGAVDAVTQAALAFPFVGDLALGAALVALLIGRLLFEWWWLSALIAGSAWLLLAHARQEAGDDLDVRLYDRVELLRGVGGAVALVWLAGALPSVIGAQAGLETAGNVVGLGLATIIAGYVVVTAARDVWCRVGEHTGVLDGEDGRRADWGLARYLLLRRAAFAAAVVLAPLPVVYVASGILTGAYQEIISTVGVVATSLVVLWCVVAVVAVIWNLTEDVHEDIEIALSEALSRQAIRAAVIGRGLTVGTATVSAAITWGWTRSLLGVAIGTTILTLLVWRGYNLVDRLAYEHDLFPDDEETRRPVLIQTYALEDADGGEHLVVQMGSDLQTTRESVDDLVDEVLDLAHGYQCGDRTIPKTPGRRRAEDVLQLGVVDGDLETELQEHIRKRLARHLRREEWIEMEILEQKCESFPEDWWRDELRRWQEMAIVTVHDDHVRLERDPWAVDSSEPVRRWLPGSSA